MNTRSDSTSWNGHVLGDDEIGELVDPVDDEEEREDADADGEGRDELLPHVAVEDVAPSPAHCTIAPCAEAWAGARGARARWARPPHGGAIDRLSRVEALRGRPRRDGRDGAAADLDAAVASSVRAGRRRDPREPRRPASPSRRPCSSRSGSTPSWRPGAARASACTASARAAGRRAHRRRVQRCPARRLGLASASTGAAAMGTWRGSRRSRTTACPELHRWAGRARRRAAAPGDLARGRVGITVGGRCDVELWRRGGRDGVERGGRSAALFPDGLPAVGFAVKGDEVDASATSRAIRAGSPAATGQTEHEDLYRLGRAARGSGRWSRRQVVNGWHRELQAAVGRLLLALDAGDAATPRALVPDRALARAVAARLDPRAGLRRGRAGHARHRPRSPSPKSASGRRVPWSLVWRRAPTGWRLTAAIPMLQ